MKACQLVFKAVVVAAALSVGCGVRSGGRPTTPEGYRHIELRDVAPLGLEDVNVEVVAPIGAMVPQEVCGGLLTFPMVSVTESGAASGGFR